MSDRVPVTLLLRSGNSHVVSIAAAELARFQEQTSVLLSSPRKVREETALQFRSDAGNLFVAGDALEGVLIPGEG
jgi:hypothetical protein